MRRARVAGAVAVLGFLGYVGLDIADVAPGVLTTDRPVVAPAGAPGPTLISGPAAPTTSAPTTSAPTTPATPAPAPPRLGLRPAGALPLDAVGSSAATPDPAALTAAVGTLIADPALGPSVGAVVRDGLTGQVLYAKDEGRPRTPASTTKLVTAAAIATSMPMATTLDTSVVAGAPGEIVLVAGGDTLLGPGVGAPAAVPGRAGLADLADQVAVAVQAGRVATTSGPLRLVLDEAGLAGPRIDPAWVPADVDYGYAGPVAPLGLTTYRPTPGTGTVDDPALATAVALRGLLAARGLALAPGVSRGTAPAGAARLGIVRSAPVGDQLAVALAESDNTLSSALARVAAVRAGVAPTFPAVAAWVVARVAALGVPSEGLEVADPSGLAPGSKASAATLAALLVKGADGSSPELARVYGDLPAAGLTGTLAQRYLTGPARAGAGLVRAKTGTLTGVSSLAGTVVDADGRLLAFAVLADRVPPTGTDEARQALDRFAARLAGCGCR